MYIPIENIVLTKYTNGNEYVLPGGLNYIGYYVQTTDGNIYSKPSDGNESGYQVLSAVSDSRSLVDINKQNFTTLPFTKFNKGVSLDNVNLLSGDFIEPQDLDYSRGWFNRFVAKYRASSSLTFIEINQNNYNYIVQNKSVSPYYQTSYFPWKLSGALYDVYDNKNIRVSSGVVDSNKRAVQQASISLPGLAYFVTDYQKWYKQPS